LAVSKQQVVPAASPVIPVGQIWVDKAGLSKALCLSARQIDYMRARGIIPCIELGNRFVRFNLAEVTATLERRYRLQAAGNVKTKFKGRK
jgi:hypothetical protein